MTLNFEMHFVKFHPEVALVYSPEAKENMHPWDGAIMNIHKKLFSRIPINFTHFCHISKTTKNLKLFATRKIWDYVLLPVEPWG